MLHLFSKLNILKCRHRPLDDFKYSSKLQKLTSIKWGCSAKTLRITTQTMVVSVANYFSPVWMNSSQVKLVDTQIYKALGIICGSVHPTETEWLYVLSIIVPARIMREEAKLLWDSLWENVGKYLRTVHSKIFRRHHLNYSCNQENLSGVFTEAVTTLKKVVNKSLKRIR